MSEINWDERAQVRIFEPTSYYAASVQGGCCSFLIIPCRRSPGPRYRVARDHALPVLRALCQKLLIRLSRLRRQTVGRNLANGGAAPLPRERSWRAAVVRHDG